MIYKKSIEKIQNDTEAVKKLIEKRGHVFIKGICENNKSPLTVYCPKHDCQIVTDFGNYKRSKTGLSCCGKQQVSEKLKGRVYSPETIKRMSLGASKRPDRGGQIRSWRKTPIYAKWRREVFRSYNNQCAVTGITLKDTKNFVGSTEQKTLIAHHLYSATSYPTLTYIVENGIVLERSIHVLFHDTFGYTENTLDQFIIFLKSPLLKKKLKEMSKPISSQARLESLEGSETRAYDPDRVMKLHERLGKLAVFLNTQYDL